MDVPVIEGTTDLPGATRNVQEGEEIIDLRYEQVEGQADVYRYREG